MPYIYSASIEANDCGKPICRALPLMYDDEAASNVVSEYMFGDSLLVGAFSDKIYLPKGYVWYDAWTGKCYEGGEEISVEVPEGRGGPLFIRGGAIIPTEKPKQYEDDINTANLILNLYPSGKSEYTLYEDDGITFNYENGERAYTKFTMVDDGKGFALTIGERVGAFNGMTESRTYTAKVRLDKAPASVKVDGVQTAVDYENGFASFEIGNGKKVEVIYG
jgi:alpha-glucosidase (family GH31 glycosyl hydrolase)